MDNEKINEIVTELGYEEVLLFEKYDYADALIGISADGRAVYSYEKMINFLIKKENFSYEDAVEWIDYNTLRALPYFGDKAPVIVTEEEYFKECEE